MSIRILCSILILACVAKADDLVFNAKRKATPKYILVPAEYCNAVEISQSAKRLCAPQRMPFDLGDYSIVPSTELGYVQLAARTSTETEGLELLCYRCTLEKGSKSKCSRYGIVWGNPKWTESCTKVKD